MSTATAVAVDRVEQTRPAQERLFSLDLFRGATIAAMIVVNNQSSDDAYWPLQHARWNGWTPTDLVFPFFSSSSGFRWSSRSLPPQSRRIAAHACSAHLRRSAVLFAIGLGLNGLAALEFGGWRIRECYNELLWCIARQRCLRCSRASAVEPHGLWTAAGYWVLMRYVPVPGYGVPGRDIPLLHQDANLAAYLDRKFMLGHLWEPTRDPEEFSAHCRQSPPPFAAF